MSGRMIVVLGTGGTIAGRAASAADNIGYRAGEIGVARVSVGSGFFLAAMGALAAAGRELLDDGSYHFWDSAGRGQEATSAAFA